jgi:hypothetical protein
MRMLVTLEFAYAGAKSGTHCVLIVGRGVKTPQAGGWKSTRMSLQYAERINAARSGMARAAAATKRSRNRN